MVEQMRHFAGSTEALIDRLDSAVLPRRKPGVELSIGIVLWPRFPLLSLSGLTDALRHAADIGDQSRPIRCQWKVLGAPGSRTVASCGLDVPADDALTEPQRFDYVVVIGGLLSAMDDVAPGYWQFLQQTAAARVPLIGLCTGSFVLARAGLLEGRGACVHAYHREDWKRLHPTLRQVNNCDYLVDGERITCAGGVSVVELAVYLIGLHCGADRAAKVIHQMTVAKTASGGSIDRRKALGYANMPNRRMREAVILMEKHMAEPLEVDTIARLVGTSKRQLERIFQEQTSSTPSQFYRLMRLRFGRWLLISSERQIGEIAYECGFADAPHFIRHFQRQFGLSPGKLRTLLENGG